MKLHPDPEIIEAFTNGDHAAFRQVFNCYYPALCYFSEKMTGNTENAEEIVMGVFRKLFERCIHFNSAADIKAFLYITARNNCLDYLRSASVSNKEQKEFARKMKNDDCLLAEYSIKYELMERMRITLKRLPEECRKVFMMINFEGMTAEEVAEILQLPISAVNAQKCRANQALGLAPKD